MSNYRLTEEAKKDLIRIHQYGVHKFGMDQATLYFESFFKYFDIIAKRPCSFECLEFMKCGYKRFVFGSDVIYYRINNGIVEIITIIGRKDFNNNSY